MVTYNRWRGEPELRGNKVPTHSSGQPRGTVVKILARIIVRKVFNRYSKQAGHKGKRTCTHNISIAASKSSRNGEASAQI